MPQEELSQDICFQIANLKFRAKELNDKEAAERLKNILIERKALPLLQELAKELPFISLTLTETDTLKTAIDEELAKLEERIKVRETFRVVTPLTRSLGRMRRRTWEKVKFKKHSLRVQIFWLR